MGDLDRVSKLSEGHFLTRLDTRDRVTRRERQDPGSQQGHHPKDSDKDHDHPQGHPDVVELHREPNLPDEAPASGLETPPSDPVEPDSADRPAHLDISA